MIYLLVDELAGAGIPVTGCSGLLGGGSVGGSSARSRTLSGCGRIE